jgi:hypothetical protein
MELFPDIDTAEKIAWGEPLNRVCLSAKADRRTLFCTDRIWIVGSSRTCHRPQQRFAGGQANRGPRRAGRTASGLLSFILLIVYLRWAGPPEDQEKDEPAKEPKRQDD